MGLHKEERVLSALWLTDNLPLEARAGANIEAIGLDTRAIRSTTGYLKLSYEFTNSTACLALIAKMKNVAF
jgi:hypothetical protein